MSQTQPNTATVGIPNSGPADSHNPLTERLLFLEQQVVELRSLLGDVARMRQPYPPVFPAIPGTANTWSEAIVIDGVVSEFTAGRACTNSASAFASIPVGSNTILLECGAGSGRNYLNLLPVAATNDAVVFGASNTCAALDTQTWSGVGATNGVKLWVWGTPCWNTNTATLSMNVRQVEWNSMGQIVAIGAETNVTIDTTLSCTNTTG